ncbi:MAG TPA: hypothetical protein VKA48_12695 [Gammaproteobacteria bacterium]|nr:hypothetical protein [Gammaproteobacteria bacterium]
MQPNQLEWDTVLSTAIDNLSAQEKILESLGEDGPPVEAVEPGQVLTRAYWRSHRRRCRLALSILDKLSRDPEAPDPDRRRKILHVLDAEFERLGEEWPAQ